MLEAILLAFYFLLVALQELFTVAISGWLFGAVALALVIVYVIYIVTGRDVVHRRVT